MFRSYSILRALEPHHNSDLPKDEGLSVDDTSEALESSTHHIHTNTFSRVFETEITQGFVTSFDDLKIFNAYDHAMLMIFLHQFKAKQDTQS